MQRAISSKKGLSRAFVRVHVNDDLSRARASEWRNRCQRENSQPSSQISFQPEIQNPASSGHRLGKERHEERGRGFDARAARL